MELGVTTVDTYFDTLGGVSRAVQRAKTQRAGGQVAEVADRMMTVITRELELVAKGQTIVVVTHGGSARAVIAKLIGLPPEHWAVLGVLTNCAWSVLTEKDSAYGPPWRLQEYNAGSLPVPALADDR